MTTLEVLEQARDHIRDPENWCQGTGVGATGCALQAVYRFAPTMSAEMAGARALSAHVPADGDWEKCEHIKCVACYNDSHTHAEVLELFHLAIAAELSEEQATEPVREPVLSGAC